MAMRVGQIGDDELVLEIGSGDRPNPRADVLLDRYVEDNTERGGNLRIDRPLIVGEAEELPFKDGAFDYIICFHILEHMADPTRFLRELMRVGKRGWIQSPSEIAERMFHWAFHRWYVNLVDGKLILHPLDYDGADRATFGDLFHHLYAHNPRFARFSRSMPALFYVDYEWSGTIDFEVRDSSPLDLRDPATLERLVRPQETLVGGLKGNATSLLRDLAPRPALDLARRVTRRRKPTTRTFDLDALLACPACHGDLIRRADEYTCDNCGRSYPIRRGLPHLLIEESREGASGKSEVGSRK